MTRSILTVIAVGLAVGIVSATGCSQTGVGDPCTPEQEFDTQFNGFSKDEVNVESKSMEILNGDILVLCSDGLSGMVKDSAMEETVGTADEIETAGSRLVSMANDAGGRDNITVILARFKGPGLRAPLKAVETEAKDGEEPVERFVAPEAPAEPVRKSKSRYFLLGGILLIVVAGICYTGALVGFLLDAIVSTCLAIVLAVSAAVLLGDPAQRDWNALVLAVFAAVYVRAAYTIWKDYAQLRALQRGEGAVQPPVGGLTEPDPVEPSPPQIPPEPDPAAALRAPLLGRSPQA